MNIDVYDFVQLAFLVMDGEIKGKTKLQKTVYFLAGRGKSRLTGVV